MKVEIITPKRIELEQEAKAIILPTRLGEISVLENHVPLISVLNPGIMTIVAADNERIEKEIEGGILEVSKDKAVILLKKF
jgi:F-type H+-transporting ATPase subunit epsilon